MNNLTDRAAIQVARVFRDGTLVGMTDRQILDRFVERHDEAAFDAILTRHGPMVRNVCRQLLFNSHDVDDAFQAVFLVLVRKARFLRVDESLGPWLYKVAGRVAARARADRRKLHAREISPSRFPEPSYSTSGDQFEISQVLHDELGRLPERLRAPLVLCHLAGLTHDLAARELQCPVGTVRSRLARGRNLLHRRIIRRGLTLSVAAFAGVLESGARATAVSCLPASLVESITRAMGETIRQDSMGFSTSLASILEGVLRVSQIKKIAIMATAISVGAMAFVVVERTTDGQSPKQESQAVDVLDGIRPPGLTPDRPETHAVPTPKNDRYTRAIESKLNGRISVNIDRQPLSDAVAFVQKNSGVNIVLDPKALREAGLTSSSPVSLHVDQVPLKSVLKLLLRPLGLTYRIEDEVILITSAQATAIDSKPTYPRTYYVGDLVPPWGATNPQRTPTATAAGVQPQVDMTPLMDLIELTVAPGSWNVQHGNGHQVPPKPDSRENLSPTRSNAMVPFFLSVSLIIKAPEDVHQDVAKLLRALRRVRFGSEEWIQEEERLAASTPQPARTQTDATPAPDSTAGSRKTIEQLLDALREEVRKLDSAPSVKVVVPLQR